MSRTIGLGTEKMVFGNDIGLKKEIKVLQAENKALKKAIAESKVATAGPEKAEKLEEKKQ